MASPKLACPGLKPHGVRVVGCTFSSPEQLFREGLCPASCRIYCFLPPSSALQQGKFRNRRAAQQRWQMGSVHIETCFGKVRTGRACLQLRQNWQALSKVINDSCTFVREISGLISHK